VQARGIAGLDGIAVGVHRHALAHVHMERLAPFRVAHRDAHLVDQGLLALGGGDQVEPRREHGLLPPAMGEALGGQPGLDGPVHRPRRDGHAVHRQHDAGRQQEGTEVAREILARLVVLDLHAGLEARMRRETAAVDDAPDAVAAHREAQLLAARADGRVGGDRQQLLEAAAHAPALGHAVLLAGDEHHVEPGQVVGARAVVGAADGCPPRSGRLDVEVDAPAAAHAVQGVLHQLLDQVLQRAAALLLGEALRRDGEPLAFGKDGRGGSVEGFRQAGLAGVDVGMPRGGVGSVLLIHGLLRLPCRPAGPRWHRRTRVPRSRGSGQIAGIATAPERLCQAGARGALNSGQSDLAGLPCRAAGRRHRGES